MTTGSHDTIFLPYILEPFVNRLTQLLFDQFTRFQKPIYSVYLFEQLDQI